MSALRINVSELLNRSLAHQHIVVDEVFPDLVTSTAAVPGDEPVHLDVTLERIPDGIVVRGHVVTRWTAPCRLCTEVIVTDLDVPIGELFEADPIEGETYPITGLEVDLEQVVRDTVLPELPIAPSCGGVERTACAARAAAIAETVIDEPDPRWAVLAQLVPERHQQSSSPRSN